MHIYIYTYVKNNIYIYQPFMMVKPPFWLVDPPFWLDIFHVWMAKIHSLISPLKG